MDHGDRPRPGAITQGKDLDEAREMIKDAIELLLESYREQAQQESSENAIWENVTVSVPNS